MTPVSTQSPQETEIQDAANRLRDLMGRLRRQLNAHLPAGAPTLPELAVLAHLDRGGELSQAKLAALQQVRPQSMGATVTTMQEHALVRRRPDTADRRKILVSLTPQGRRQLRRLRRSRQDWLAAAMTAQLATAEQRTVIDAISLLERLLDAPAADDAARARTDKVHR